MKITVNIKTVVPVFIREVKRGRVTVEVEGQRVTLREGDRLDVSARHDGNVGRDA